MASRIVGDDVLLSYDSYGSENNPLVLLIPGAGAPADFWPEDFCRAIAKHDWYVVRYSHRDTGFSSHYDEQYSIDALLLDLLAFVASFESNNVHLVGHSMGGFLAQLAMCKPVSCIASVTSISAGSTVSPEISDKLSMSSPSQAIWEKLMENQPSGLLKDDMDGWLASWRFLNGTRPFDENAALEYTRCLYEGDARNAQVAVNHVHAMTTVPDSLATEITQTRTPLLVLHGTDDSLVPFDHGKATAQLAPNSRLVPIAGAGHMFFDGSSWQEILSAVLEHVSKVRN